MYFNRLTGLGMSIPESPANPLSKTGKDGIWYNPFSRNKRQSNTEIGELEKQWYLQNELQQMTDLAVSRFIYKNTPDNIDFFYIEEKLFLDGYAVVIKDPMKGVYIATGNFSGRPNTNGEQPYFLNSTPGYKKELLSIYDDRLVLFKNTSLKTSDFRLTLPYLSEMADLRYTRMVNSQTLANPLILRLRDPKQKEEVEEALVQISKAPYVVVHDDGKEDEKTSVDMIEPLNFDVNDHMDSLFKAFNSAKAEALTVIGIETNIENDKKERLVVDEVKTTHALVQRHLNARLWSRRKAVRDFNDKFNYSVKVATTRDLEEVMENRIDGINTRPST